MDRERWPARVAKAVQSGGASFTDPRFEGSYRDKPRRWVSQVLLAVAVSRA